MGGHDISRDPAWFNDPAIDILAIGDGVEIMPERVAALEQGSDLKTVPGLVLSTQPPASSIPTPPHDARSGSTR